MILHFIVEADSEYIVKFYLCKSLYENGGVISEKCLEHQGKIDSEQLWVPEDENESNRLAYRMDNNNEFEEISETLFTGNFENGIWYYIPNNDLRFKTTPTYCQNPNNDAELDPSTYIIFIIEFAVGKNVNLEKVIAYMPLPYACVILVGKESIVKLELPFLLVFLLFCYFFSCYCCYYHCFNSCCCHYYWCHCSFIVQKVSSRKA